ncbi:hypothetical protein NC652_005112 [Populus alba x Populus x berolinensis]|uniref:Uncharacterized protein n=1 Tax=Populus alba x Populus x berolinensis TaxID=444605 RepID=A0AAD6WCM2_9ROSI|nr:hypothetical protein NC652_005112 [Populus alba x Populus x berolinensis]KAJ7005634.1 hypothetical protein NC653_005065 [Populus alba x Populus x berolinensis]
MIIEGDGEGPPNTGSRCWTQGGERKENNTPAGRSLLAPGSALSWLEEPGPRLDRAKLPYVIRSYVDTFGSKQILHVCMDGAFSRESQEC